jgi:aminomuconate-semialdehyde/2-hydroxymuconate-6-semialdehyde dehydrogenase
MLSSKQFLDVLDAIQAAKAAFPSWKVLSFEHRFDLLLKLANGIEARMNEFVEAESMDNGKPQWLAAQSDIPRAISNLKFFASAQMNFPSESHHTPNKV